MSINTTSDQEFFLASRTIHFAKAISDFKDDEEKVFGCLDCAGRLFKVALIEFVLAPVGIALAAFEFVASTVMCLGVAAIGMLGCVIALLSGEDPISFINALSDISFVVDLKGTVAGSGIAILFLTWLLFDNIIMRTCAQDSANLDRYSDYSDHTLNFSSAVSYKFIEEIKGLRRNDGECEGFLDCGERLFKVAVIETVLLPAAVGLSTVQFVASSAMLIALAPIAFVTNYLCPDNEQSLWRGLLEGAGGSLAALKMSVMFIFENIFPCCSCSSDDEIDSEDNQSWRREEDNQSRRREEGNQTYRLPSEDRPVINTFTARRRLYGTVDKSTAAGSKRLETDFFESRNIFVVLGRQFNLSSDDLVDTEKNILWAIGAAYIVLNDSIEIRGYNYLFNSRTGKNESKSAKERFLATLADFYVKKDAFCTEFADSIKNSLLTDEGFKAIKGLIEETSGNIDDSNEVSDDMLKDLLANLFPDKAMVEAFWRLVPPLKSILIEGGDVALSHGNLNLFQQASEELKQQ